MTDIKYIHKWSWKIQLMSKMQWRRPWNIQNASIKWSHHCWVIRWTPEKRIFHEVGCITFIMEYKERVRHIITWHWLYVFSLDCVVDICVTHSVLLDNTLHLASWLKWLGDYQRANKMGFFIYVFNVFWRSRDDPCSYVSPCLGPSYDQCPGWRR